MRLVLGTLKSAEYQHPDPSTRLLLKMELPVAAKRVKVDGEAAEGPVPVDTPAAPPPPASPEDQPTFAVRFLF